MPGQVAEATLKGLSLCASRQLLQAEVIASSLVFLFSLFFFEGWRVPLSSPFSFPLATELVISGSSQWVAFTGGWYGGGGGVYIAPGAA
jgi:hypothetical protein